MKGGPAPADREFCRAILPKVSRTFALGIELLPARLGEAVRTSYLLCRIADTLEDTPALSSDQKEELLGRFATCLDAGPQHCEPLAAAFASPRTDEEHLVQESARVLRVFAELPREVRDAVRPWVQEMAQGMAEFAVRRPARQELAALATVADLERYCYYVAGTVGHLLTGLFRIYHRRMAGARVARLEALATSFGLGLQLTNIIKDVADDRRRGWSFVPNDLCELSGLRPDELQDPSHGAQAHEVMQALIRKAKAHLRDALTYCTTLPAAAYRIRIFCLTSLYFAVRTLRLAERDPRLLDPAHKVKITRGEVYRTVLATHVIAPFDTLVRGYYLHLAGEG